MKLFLDKKIQDDENELTDLFQKALYENDGNFALKYLHDNRKIDDDLIGKFRIGWCPKNFRHDGREILAGRIIFPIIEE